MQAYEFYAKPKNGVIQIPEQYKNQIADNVLVIILEKEPLKFNRNESKTQKKNGFIVPSHAKNKGLEI